MPTCPKQLLTGDEESSSKALKWRNRGSYSWSIHWHLKGQLNTQNLNWVKWLLNSLCSKCLLQNAKAKTNSPPWQMKWKFGWEAQLFTRGNTANTLLPSLLHSQSLHFKLFLSGQWALAEKSQQEHEAGHVSPHTQGNFQSPWEEGPEDRTVCQKQHYSSPWSWGDTAAICSVTWGDKGHPPEAGRRKDRGVLLLHRAAAWKKRRDGFQPCFDHMVL